MLVFCTVTRLWTGRSGVRFTTGANVLYPANRSEAHPVSYCLFTAVLSLGLKHTHTHRHSIPSKGKTLVRKPSEQISLRLAPFPIKVLLHCSSRTLCTTKIKGLIIEFLSSEPEVTFRTVAIIIRVFFSPHICAFVAFLWLPFITVNHAEYVSNKDTNTCAYSKVKTMNWIALIFRGCDYWKKWKFATTQVSFLRAYLH